MIDFNLQSSEASTAQHAERASLIARQHWQQMEGSLHVRPPNAARARRTYSHGTSQCRKATYSAVVSSRQHGTMIERKEHQIDDAKAKRFLEEERRRHRLSSTSSMDTQNPSRGYRLASQVDDAFVDGDAETSNQKERLPSRTRFHLRLGSAPESGVCSPSPASETTSFYEPFNVQKAKEELQQMAAELNSKCFYKQIGHTAPITKEQNSYVERNGDQSKKQEEANERDEQRLESTVADSSSSFEETRTVTTSPIELPVTLVCCCESCVIEIYGWAFVVECMRVVIGNRDYCTCSSFCHSADILFLFCFISIEFNSSINMHFIRQTGGLP